MGRMTGDRAVYGRLTQPLVREGRRLRKASWAEALDRAAEGFRRAVEGVGPHSVGMFSCSKATNEVNFVAQKFMRVAIGTNNIDTCNAPDTPRASSVWRQSSVPGAEPAPTKKVDETDVVVLWGSNARETNPIFFHHVLKAVHRGARLFVVDPRRTGKCLRVRHFRVGARASIGYRARAVSSPETEPATE